MKKTKMTHNNFWKEFWKCLPERMENHLKKLKDSKLYDDIPPTDKLRSKNTNEEGVRGIYVFYEKKEDEYEAVYVGRSDNIHQRLRQHRRKGRQSATFTTQLTKEKLKIKRDYKPKDEHPLFKEEFQKQSERIKQMSIRFIEIKNTHKHGNDKEKKEALAIEQATFEMYAASQLGTLAKYNSFETH